MASSKAEEASAATCKPGLGSLELRIRRAFSAPGRRSVYIASALILAFAVRLVIVSQGGQNFFYDEAKFATATDAAALLKQGHVREALVYTIEPHLDIYADHIGYKMLGIIPELFAHKGSWDAHIPAYFFSIFSALNVVLLAAIAGRLTGSRRSFDLALLAAATSASLLIYTRFIVPYDVSLFFALLALCVGAIRPAGLLRNASVGALCSWSFFCYYGHWQIAGVVMVVHVLWQTDRATRFITCSLATGAGFLAVIAALLGISRLGSNTLFHDMLEITKAQSAGATDFRSALNSWLYMLYAERAAVLAWVGIAALAFFVEMRGHRPAGARILTPLRLMLFGFAAVFAIFVVDSDIRNNLVVHGRHSRQLVPFLIVAFAVGLDALLARSSRRETCTLAAAAFLCVNAAFSFYPSLVMVFPRDFNVRAEATLAARPPLTDGKSYYRKVNVDNFTYEPEVLRDPPIETLLASPHPLGYLPYIYEGESQALKQRRRSVDHRMRLVRMAVRDSEIVRGDPYGFVTLELEFPSTRSGFTEPLLSIGPRHNGELFYVYYETKTKGRLGFISLGNMNYLGDPFDLEPGRRHTLRIFSGSLLPPQGQAMPGLTPAEASILGLTAFATLDGKVLIKQSTMRHVAQPGEVFAGVNAVEVSTAGAQFSGTILSATRGGLPPLPQGIAKDQTYGVLHLKVLPPPVSAGTAEPLFSAGKPGHAVIGYMRIFPDGKMVFGVEIWGTGNYEGATLPPRDPTDAAPLDVDISLGSLLPPPGSPSWNDVPVAEQIARSGRIVISVNGTPILTKVHETPDLASLPVFVGTNPIGGSLVNAGFSGHIVASYRLAISNSSAPGATP